MLAATVPLSELSVSGRAYRAKAGSLLQQLDTMTDQQVASVLDVLTQARKEVTDQLTRLAGKEGFKPTQLKRLRQAIDERTNELIRQLAPTLGGGLKRAWEHGADLTPELLRAVGAADLIPARDLSPQQLNVALTVAADLVQGVGDDFRAAAKRSVAFGVLGALSPWEVQQEVAELLRTEPSRQTGKLGTIAYQAERIVRTEMVGVANLANQQRHMQIGADVPGLRKYWLTAGDGRVRDSHVVAGRRYAPGGSVGPIPLEEDYEVGGFSAAMPHDPRLPARERVNCRCVSVVWSPDWEQVQRESVVLEHLPGKHDQKDHGRGAPSGGEGEPPAARSGTVSARYPMSPPERPSAKDPARDRVRALMQDDERRVFTDSDHRERLVQAMRDDPYGPGGAAAAEELGQAVRGMLAAEGLPSGPVRGVYVASPGALPVPGWAAAKRPNCSVIVNEDALEPSHPDVVVKHLIHEHIHARGPLGDKMTGLYRTHPGVEEGLTESLAKHLAARHLGLEYDHIYAPYTNAFRGLARGLEVDPTEFARRMWKHRPEDLPEQFMPTVRGVFKERHGRELTDAEVRRIDQQAAKKFAWEALTKPELVMVGSEVAHAKDWRPEAKLD